MNIGDRIKEKRLEFGWTQEDLAEAVQVRSQSISRYERGVMKVGADVLLKMAEVLGVSVEWLQTGRIPANDQTKDSYHYPSWNEWLNTMAPKDLTDIELRALEGLRFSREPEPWRYNVILDQLRCGSVTDQKQPTLTTKKRGQS